MKGESAQTSITLEGNAHPAAEDECTALTLKKYTMSVVFKSGRGDQIATGAGHEECVLEHNRYRFA